MRKLLISIIAFICLVTIVLANGVGNEIKKTVDGFSFEFGIDPKEPKANEKAIMSLSVHNTSTGEALKIEDLWIRTSKGNEILFTSNDFKISESGPMFFGYTFKESGEYDIDFSAKHDSKDVRANFIVNIKSNNKVVFKNSIVLIILFIFGFIAANIIRKIKLYIRR